MLVYSSIMFIMAIVFMVISIAIYNGRTDLIHDYHQTNVVDRLAYGKAFGKALFVITIVLILSGIIGLLDNLAMLAIVILIIGLCIGIYGIVVVQRKYNKGVF
ncbi:MAG: DUF3784 domain-containing protein [Erysipelotrichales bacterium]|nr:DUF3784 domain-containing protein [Erysipelotrichales bacterium]MBR3693402.1 DUF3784 domain-containing protein [Erysipelotrichales bacterium]